jgi:hypothetical protein
VSTRQPDTFSFRAYHNCWRQWASTFLKAVSTRANGTATITGLDRPSVASSSNRRRGASTPFVFPSFWVPNTRTNGAGFFVASHTCTQDRPPAPNFGMSLIRYSQTSERSY